MSGDLMPLRPDHDVIQRAPDVHQPVHPGEGAAPRRRPGSPAGPSGSPPHQTAPPWSGSAEEAPAPPPTLPAPTSPVTGHSSRSSSAWASASRGCCSSSRQPAPRRSVGPKAPRKVRTDRSPFPLSDPFRARHGSTSKPQVRAKISYAVQHRMTSRPRRHPRLQIVDPDPERDAAVALEELQVPRVPSQLTLIMAGPAESGPAVRQRPHQHLELLRPAPQRHPHLEPIVLGLDAGRRLHAPQRAHLRLPVPSIQVPTHGPCSCPGSHGPEPARRKSPAPGRAGPLPSAGHPPAAPGSPALHPRTRPAAVG